MGGVVEEKPRERELNGERAQRIVEAMRASVADRGIAASTFEHVAREAGVSRGLLHYYFGTKERLLIEVLRRDTELRIAAVNESLGSAASADDVIGVLVSSVESVIREDPGIYAILFELFIAGRRNAEIQRELAGLYERSRGRVAAILREKEAEGIISLRFDSETVVSYLLAAADGGALQRLTDPDRDFSGGVDAGEAVARFLLTS